MRTDQFDYRLPPDLIAQTPLEPRDSSRLLVWDRASGQVSHRGFSDVLLYLRPGDVMVFNQSRVIPARIRGRRADTGGKVEFLLLNQPEPGLWRALAQPGRRLRPGARVVLEPPSGVEPPAGAPGASGNRQGEAAGYGEVLESHADGTKTIRLPPDAVSWGTAPLPPYIHQRLDDPERYQTVYAQDPGSAAAPTAGLHFTRELMRSIQSQGAALAFVTLHVGLDTFRPVTCDNPAQHHIHTEYYQLGPEAAETINRARAHGGRVFAVGTTSVRVLEQAAARLGTGEGISSCSGWADIFILPGHRFRLVDALITNFHLPRSTLLMLVSAFAEQSRPADSGVDAVLDVYREAIAQRYRFYSFGDAMLLL